MVNSFDKIVPAKFTLKNNIITYLAIKYVSEIVKKHSVNRVILAGSSLGGNIATEMANLLEKKSIIVEQIHLFDSIETSYYRSKNQSKSKEGAPSKLENVKRDLMNRAVVFKYKMGQKMNIFNPKLFNWLSKYTNLEIGEDVFLRLMNKKEVNFLAKNLMKAGKYPIQLNPKIKIVFYQAEDTNEYDIEDCMGWKFIVKDLKSFVIKGGHTTILEKPYVYALADAMDRCL